MPHPRYSTEEIVRRGKRCTSSSSAPRWNPAIRESSWSLISRPASTRSTAVKWPRFQRAKAKRSDAPLVSCCASASRSLPVVGEYPAEAAVMITGGSDRQHAAVIQCTVRRIRLGTAGYGRRDCGYRLQRLSHLTACRRLPVWVSL